MTVEVLPDFMGALMVRYQAIAAITALTSTRISAERQDTKWAPMPRHAIFLNGPLGDPGSSIYDQMKGIQRTRVEMWFYGSNYYEAGRLWRTAHPYICPRQDSITRFKVGNCVVFNVRKEGGPSRLGDPVSADVTWPRVIATYIFTWSEQPAP